MCSNVLLVRTEGVSPLSLHINLFLRGGVSGRPDDREGLKHLQVGLWEEGAGLLLPPPGGTKALSL